MQGAQHIADHRHGLEVVFQGEGTGGFTTGGTGDYEPGTC